MFVVCVFCNFNSCFHCARLGSLCGVPNLWGYPHYAVVRSVPPALLRSRQAVQHGPRRTMRGDTVCQNEITKLTAMCGVDRSDFWKTVFFALLGPAGKPTHFETFNSDKIRLR